MAGGADDGYHDLTMTPSLDPVLEQKTTPWSARLSAVEWACLAVGAVVLVLFRLHAFDLPLETDECNYAYIGQRLLAGDRLYVDVWDHQPFGVFALFAGAIALGGDAPEVFRWLAVGFSLISLGLINAIVRRCGNAGAAILATVLFAFVSSDPGTAGEGCNREIYMNTCILAAWYLALRAGGRPGWLIFAAGLALAIGSSVKTIVAVHWLLLAPWIVWAAWRTASPDTRRRSTVLAVVLFVAGPAIFWLAALGYFAGTGRGDEFVDAVFLFNLSYSGGGEGFFARFVEFFTPDRHPFIFDSAWPIWLGGVAALLWLAVEAVARRNLQALAILLLNAASYLAICLPAQFWPHYYYLLVPNLVIALALGIGGLIEWLRAPESRLPGGVRRGAVVVVGIIFPLGLLATEYRDYLHQPPFGITVKRYNSRDFWGRAHGENVRRLTNPEDEIFVFGSDTAVYYYSQRRCASRYTMITGLKSGYGGAARRQATLLEELEEHPPRLILVLFDEPPFDGWLAFLNEYYGEAIGGDRHDRTGHYIMFVYARKDQPVEDFDWDWDRSQVGGWNLGDRPN